MEATIVALVSGIGTLISSLLVIDSVRDYWLVHHSSPPRNDLWEIVIQRLIGEVFRLMIQVMFLVAGLFFMTESGRLRSTGVLILLFIPMALASWSLYSWLRRKHQLRKDMNDA